MRKGGFATCGVETGHLKCFWSSQRLVGWLVCQTEGQKVSGTDRKCKSYRVYVSKALQGSILKLVLLDSKLIIYLSPVPDVERDTRGSAATSSCPRPTPSCPTRVSPDKKIQ